MDDDFQHIGGFVIAILALFGSSALATTCIVDPTGTSGFPDAVQSVEEALDAGTCNVIDIWCPAGGCDHGPVVLSEVTGLTIRSMEATGAGGPVILDGWPHALLVENSQDIVVEGISSYASPGGEWAVVLRDSEVDLIGLPGLRVPRYADVHGENGMLIQGGSDVDLNAVGITENAVGLRLESGEESHPVVRATALALLDNAVAVAMEGGSDACPRAEGPTLTVRSDFDVAWHNYVLGNDNGFSLTGGALLQLDHTLLGGNLRSGGFPLLFHLQQASRLEARNILAYDNDQMANPGVPTPCASTPCVKTAGQIIRHESCDAAVVEASTVVDNQVDIVFELIGSGSGQLTLDHVLVARNTAKVFSQSSYVVDNARCAPVTAVASRLWENRVDVDPAVCGTYGASPWHPGFASSPGPVPDHLASYPAIPARYTDLYRISVLEPITPYALPAGLYDIGSWTVDGTTVDADPLDVGYHNPM